ncbi:tyrosine-type recombinase/integrase [Paracoccus nototheniae]|uniref:Tyrosine-type recombinase/integrase n=1 Tax=Paracoccus nototheniae TaxID=2489002 RepID=A0ABW4DWY6_9RHOB|nr:tyrosine-type recombinase/integrase [Paracoccus nototheniae]
MSAKYIQKKGNVWYFRRRVAVGCEGLHRDAKGKPQSGLFFSLKTGDQIEAAKRANDHAKRQDALWANHLSSGFGEAVDPKAALGRLEAAGLKPGDGLRYPDSTALEDLVQTLTGGPYEPGDYRPEPDPQSRLTYDLLMGKQMPRTLSDAQEKHIALGKGPRNKTAQQQYDRAWSVLMGITGDAILTDVRREHANRFVEKLRKRGITAETISKYVYQVKPVFDTAIREFELGIPNPFESLTIAGKGSEKPHKRLTYALSELEAIWRRCREVDDERRWAIAMLSDTGARQAEVVGLRKEDLILTGDVPHILIRPNANRGLKNDQSERKVPLVGEALWAAQRAMTTAGEHLFPVFQPRKAGATFNPNSASAALNKWLKDNGLAKAGQGLHSFRHTLVDRLRDAGVPKDVREKIGGWKSQGVSEGYGQGFSIAKLHEALLMISMASPNSGII